MDERREMFNSAIVEQAESHMQAQMHRMGLRVGLWICPECAGVEVVQGWIWLPGELVEESPDDVAGLTGQCLSGGQRNGKMESSEE
jgi:hypothetical protein